MTLKLAFDIRKVSTGDRRSSSVRIFEPYDTFNVRAEVGQVTFRVGFGPICKRDQPLGRGPFRTTFCFTIRDRNFGKLIKLIPPWGAFDKFRADRQSVR